MPLIFLLWLVNISIVGIYLHLCGCALGWLVIIASKSHVYLTNYWALIIGVLYPINHWTRIPLLLIYKYLYIYI